MSRRRTGKRFVPITISLQPSMIDEVEVELSAKQSRSQWIADAIKAKLQEHELTTGVREASTGFLMSELSRRDDINGEQKGILQYWLSQWGK